MTLVTPRALTEALNTNALATSTESPSLQMTTAESLRALLESVNMHNPETKAILEAATEAALQSRNEAMAEYEKTVEVLAEVRQIHNRPGYLHSPATIWLLQSLVKSQEENFYRCRDAHHAALARDRAYGILR